MDPKMTTMVDQKRALNKLKHDLEPWRNVIVLMDSVLVWEKNYYPAVISGVITLYFFALWLLDFSTVTMLALFGVFCVGMDFMSPSVARFFYNPEHWTGEQEEHFDNICSQLCGIKLTIQGWYDYLFASKDRKSTMFVIIMSASLLLLAWIGSVINNLFLMYLITLAVFMYPGMKEKKIFKGVTSKFGCLFNSKVQQLRENVKKSD